ncbi:MAG: excinuclease ABC subunit UvrC [Pelagibacteraceae bacterium]
MNNLDLGKRIIRNKIPLLPKNPGVYRMLSSKKEILYIGKAKNIPNRLRSYISDGNLPIRTERMLSQTKYLETTTTSNESEALLLEANLIKKYKPRFNILLKDDKSFPYIFLSEHDFPRIEKHRGVKNKPGRYFGPFASAMAVNSAIKTLQKIFLLRSCTDQQVALANKTCFNYYLKRCSGPCGGKISKEDYSKLVESADEFLSSGKYRKIQKNLSIQMDKASNELDFEKAASFRDKIKSLNIIQSSLKISEANLIEADIVAGYKESGKTCIQVFFFRSKQNWGNQAFFPKHDGDEKLSNILSSFIAQFYENKSIPSLIITSHKINEQKLLEKTFSLKENKKIIIKVAKKKEEKSVSLMAEKNARQALTQKLNETQSNISLIKKLAKKFKLNNQINLIEVYDNSHIQGTDCIGGLITFGNEGFIKKRYRKFNIKDNDVKGDDYGMLKEVLFRRFSKVMKEKSGALSLPDLVMIDGGKGQYSSSRKILNDLKLNKMPIIAIAKGKNRNAGNETIYFENKEYKFIKNDPLLFFIQRLRDEAHRFAITSHRTRRKKGISKSLLDQIPGIGKLRKRALLNHFGSARAVESASFDEIKSVEGIEDNIAKKIYNYFHE